MDGYRKRRVRIYSRNNMYRLWLYMYKVKMNKEEKIQFEIVIKTMFLLQKILDASTLLMIILVVAISKLEGWDAFFLGVILFVVWYGSLYLWKKAIFKNYKDYQSHL
jgi:hypothetical protein